MKDKLDIQQSSRLIELGVDESKASATKYTISTTETYCGYSRDIVVVDGYIENYISKEPIFTLSDLLSLLPKEVEAPNGGGKTSTYYLYIVGTNKGNTVYYQRKNNTRGIRTSPELIDCLYELLCWTIKNGYLKL